MRLSEYAVALLAGLPYRPDAEWQVNILSFGSIYWMDEMPPIGELLAKQDDMLIILRMFGIRLQLWDGEVLSAQDQHLWNGVTERQVEEEFECLSDGSDVVPDE